MKVDIIKKFKWYIVGFILVAIMLSVSLSFCTWDSLSLQVKLNNNGSGSFQDMYKLVHDPNNNRLADVGDIVEYGNYYQNNNEIDKSPLKWIVADKVLNTATNKYELSLVAENILSFGSFYGVTYTKSNVWPGPLYTLGVGKYVGHQNYSQSTVRAWLNFDGSNNYLRNDFSTQFSLTSTDGVTFKGFYNQAFSKAEQDNIISKTISNMRGAEKFYSDSTYMPPIEDYETVADKVWLPSYSEVFGSGIDWKNSSDGSPNKQFEYFQDNISRVAKTTAFASSHLSNYTLAGMQSSWNGNWQNTKAGDAAFWMMRSPSPVSERGLIYTSVVGKVIYNSLWVVDAMYGVRPAIILPY